MFKFKKRFCRTLKNGSVSCLLLVCLIIVCPFIAYAGEAHYVYDAIGRLIKVIDDQGNEAAYNYDAVGNLLSITTNSVTDAVAIVDIDPWEGDIGTPVTIYGKGFSSIPGANIVTFNGTMATVTSSTTSAIVTSVPAGATTGRVTVQTPLGSAMSQKDFTVKQAISITISPSLAFLSSGKSWQFTATVTGTANTSVTWSVEGMEGGVATIGTITADGLYTSPVNTTDFAMVTITARSIADISRTAAVPVYLNVANASSNLVSIAFPPQPQTVQRGPIISSFVSVDFQRTNIQTYGPILASDVSITIQQQPLVATISPVISPDVSVSVGISSQQSYGPVISQPVSTIIGP